MDRRHRQIDPLDRGLLLAIRGLLVVFLLVCIFDPVDQIVGGKVFVFAALWAMTIVRVLLSRDGLFLPPMVVAYVAIFIAIPLASIALYYVLDGRLPFEGIPLLKGYLLISLTLVLVVNETDLLPQLCGALTLLACGVIVVYIAIWIEPGLYDRLAVPGDPPGVGPLLLSKRSYGDEITLLQIYFVTSPMLAISIAYYFHCAMSAVTPRAKLFLWTITGLNVLGMLLAGSRNNILVAVLLPWLLWSLYIRRRVLWAAGSLLAGVAAALVFSDYLSAFFDPMETANQLKIGLLNDYREILSEPVTLLFGQGLGAYQYWSVRPTTYISELTYLELVRNFGVIGALPVMGLLVVPIAAAIADADRKDLSIALAWGLYLVMCASNPNLFSSMGMLILSILVANIAIHRKERLSREPAVLLRCETG